VARRSHDNGEADFANSLETRAGRVTGPDEGFMARTP
jgi:hypothetical protein